MTEQHTQTIFATATALNLDTPQNVLAAEELHDTAILLAAEIEAEAEPDLTTVNIKNIRKVHQAAFDYANRNTRLEIAQKIVKQTLDQLDTVKFQHAQHFWTPMAARFDKSAAAFEAALNELSGDTSAARGAQSPELAASYGRLLEASRELDVLREARDAFANHGRKAETLSTFFEPVSRFAVVPDKESLIHLPRPARGPEFWAELLHYRCTLRWQTPSEQETNSEHVASTRAETRV